MNARLIKDCFEQYKSFLRSESRNERRFLWESLQNFSHNWDAESSDLLSTYDKSLQNSHTKRLWKREAYEPKKMMMEFIKMDTEWTRQMFSELFDETKSPEVRASRFIFYCDHLLDAYKTANPLSIDNNHYHDDGYEMISLYLAFHSPENYTIYRHEPFVSLLKKIEAVNPPIVPDIERFVKVSRTLYKMMKNDEELMELHQKRLLPGESYEGESLLLVFDFYMAVTNSRF